MASAEPRRLARADFSDGSRIELLEQDMDAREREQAEFMREMRGEMKGLKNMAVGVMLTATTATIVGAINLVYLYLGRAG